MVLHILVPNWQPLFWHQNGDLKGLIRVAGSSLKRVDPSCWILKPKWPNILHDTGLENNCRLNTFPDLDISAANSSNSPSSTLSGNSNCSPGVTSGVGRIKLVFFLRRR